MQAANLIVYINGHYRAYGSAHVGLLSAGLQYGVGCFEGIRGFWADKLGELNVLQLRQHFTRLEQSAKMLMIPMPITVDEASNVTLNLLSQNGFKTDVYIRPFLFKANEGIGMPPLQDGSDTFAIVAVPFDGLFQNEGGLTCAVSSWRRVDDLAAPARGKITGTYVNSTLAKTEAKLSGFDEAIMLSQDGHVSEGSSENLFIVRGETISTPDPSQNILEGITRDIVMKLAKAELGLSVVERTIDRSELFCADEVFLTGTAAGLQWVSAIDRRAVGGRVEGPVSRELRSLYDRLTHNDLPKYRHWLSKVDIRERRNSG